MLHVDDIKKARQVQVQAACKSIGDMYMARVREYYD